MPSETMESSSFFSKELSFHDERQLGYWNTDGINKCFGAKADGALSPYISTPLKGVQGNSLISNGFEHTDSDLKRYQRADVRVESFSSTLENASNLSLLRGFEQNLGSASYFTEGDKVQFSRALNGNDPFLSSLPELCSQRLRYSPNNIHSGPSVGAEDHHDEKETFESLQELEAQTIGNLLPDDDELFYGVADTIDSKDRLISRDVSLDEFFSNVGGSELQEDGQIKFEALEGDLNSSLRRSNSTTGLNYPICEYPSRTLFVRNINSSIQDSELLALFGQYGDISSLHTTCKRRGFVMISYYDIRSACSAMKALQNESIHQRNLDVHFSIPKENPSDKDVDQGTLVVFNLESSISNDELRQIFGVYGEIKEIREMPQRSPHKLVEFYDVRAADAAFRALNKIGNADTNMKLEPSRPGSASWSMQQFSSSMDQEHSGLHLQRSVSPGGITSTLDNGMVLSARFSGRPPLSPNVDSASHNGISSRAPSRSPYLTNVDSVGNQSNSMERSNPHGQLQFDIWGTPDSRSRSLPDHQDRFANGGSCKSPGNMTAGHIARPSEPQENQFCRVSPRGHPVDWNETIFNSSGNGNCLSPGQHYMWNTSPRPQPLGIMWPNSPSHVNGTCSPRPQQMNAISRPPSSGIAMGSSPSGNSSLWERRHGYAAESQDTSTFNSGSLGGLNIPGTFPSVMELIPNNMFLCNGGSPMDSAHSHNVQLHRQNQTFLMVSPGGQLSPLLSPLESPNERTRGRRSDGSLTPSDKKQFELDIDRIMNGEDKRTTLMIKNIPNKYTSKMLLSTIDEHHKGTYDFLYLPIDFKNKCNVGYSFINMIDPSFIVPLYQTFNGKKWEKFNSEKVASIAYARIQGKAALVTHFQNSSLMNEDKRCRPMLFNTDGPNAGDQVPFPVGANIRSRARIKPSGSSENVQEVLQDSPNEEEISNGNSCSDTSSSKDSD